MPKYGFEIALNNEKLSRAGLDAEYYVVSCILTSMMRKKDDQEEISITIGGLNSSTQNHVEWINRTISKGDKITIEVVEGEFDPPARIYEKDSDEVVLEQKIKYFHRLKEELKEHLKE